MKTNDMRKKKHLLSARLLLLPVISMVTGHESVYLHDASGKPGDWIESVATARNLGEGICNKGGYPFGLSASK